MDFTITLADIVTSLGAMTAVIWPLYSLFKRMRSDREDIVRWRTHIEERLESHIKYHCRTMSDSQRDVCEIKDDIKLLKAKMDEMAVTLHQLVGKVEADRSEK